MLSHEVENFAMAFGYTNASWTLKADLSCEYVCRLLNHNNCCQGTARHIANVEKVELWDVTIP